jgi:UDP-N-acetylmuramyl pentapeptide phosphotransferase/UDP-N-acetylglucosamine-1-phosphate transferase
MSFNLIGIQSLLPLMNTQVHWVLLFFGTWIGYLASSLMISRVAPMGFYDLPSAARINSTSRVPRTAGLAFMSTLFIGHQFGFISLPFINTLVWGSVGFMGLLGLADDFNREQPLSYINAAFKTKYSLAIASITSVGLLWPQISTFGIFSIFFSDPESNILSPQWYLSDNMIYSFFGYEIPSLYSLLFLGIVLLCWALPNLFNLIDGLDGFAMGYFGMVIFVAMRLPNGDLIPGPFFWGLWAMIFYLNLRKIHFLGDAGSLSMGLFLAIVSLMYIQPNHLENFLFLFAYLILDALHVVLIRFKQNRPLSQGDRCHFHHFVYRQTGEKLRWTLPALWLLAFLPMLRLWGTPLYQNLSSVGMGLLAIALMFSFTVQINEKTAPLLKN